ncbi:C10 family peptidase, partial [Porphyromonas loveana]
NATSSTDKKARKAFQRLGYTNVPRIEDFSKSKVEESLSNNSPVYIGGYRKNFDLLFISIPYKGHAWVIDGTLERESQTRYYNYNGELVTTLTNRQSYFHCNWGWAGDSNGFFYKDVFNASVGPLFYDNGDYGHPIWTDNTLFYKYDLDIIRNIKP